MSVLTSFAVITKEECLDNVDTRRQLAIVAYIAFNTAFLSHNPPTLRPPRITTASLLRPQTHKCNDCLPIKVLLH